MNDDVRSEVVRRWYGEQPMRQIARELHVSRKTVAKVIARHQQQRAKGTTGLPSPPEKRGSPVDSYEAALRDYLARYPNISVVRLLEELRRLGYRVRYTTSAGLLEDLRKALAEQNLPRRVRYWSRFDLVVIDEFGFDRIERGECPQAANLFYKVIDARSGRRFTALATNIDFEAWAAVQRLSLHHAAIQLCQAANIAPPFLPSSRLILTPNQPGRAASRAPSRNP